MHVPSHVRGATASISTAIALVLATLGPVFTRNYLVLAVLSAAVVCVGSVYTIAHLRRSEYRNPLTYLSALGGTIILGLGMLNAAASISALDRALAIALKATLLGVPAAAIAMFIGGLGQLPRSWIPVTLAAVGGAPTVGYLSLGRDSVTTRALVATAAIITLTGCIFAFRRALHASQHTFGKWAVLGSTLVIGSIMAYAFLIAVTPANLWTNYASPLFLAGAYTQAASVVAIAGVTYDETSPSN